MTHNASVHEELKSHEVKLCGYGNETKLLRFGIAAT